jgi:hypothetical protein
MAILKRDDILKAPDQVVEVVAVPEWGGEVCVRSLSAAERDRLEASMVKVRGKERSVNLENVRAKMLSMAVCDEDGKRLFSEADVRELGGKNAAAVQRVFVVAQRLAGLSDDDVAELVEEIKDDPFSASPSV